MSARNGVTLLVVQVLLVLSIGAKYSWERHHCPAVWARAQQFDPSQPLRGRYLAISVYVSACGLSANDEVGVPPFLKGQRIVQTFGAQQWQVVPAVKDGVLTGKVVEATRPGPTQTLFLDAGMPCEYARLNGTSDFFVSEHAKSPFPLKAGQELWALMTVPPSGPVRPVKLAISDATGFHALALD